MIETKPRFLENIPDLWHIPATEEQLALFTLPFVPRTHEQQLLDQFRMEVDQMYETGLVIGRFQPVHYGHIFLIKQALQVCKTLTIGIGVSGKRDKDNPWCKEITRERLERVIAAQGIDSRLQNIVYLDDHDDDNLWLAETTKRVGRIDIVVGNNDWVNDIFAQKNYKVATTPMYHRNEYEGRKIREAFRKSYGLPH